MRAESSSKAKPEVELRLGENPGQEMQLLTELATAGVIFHLVGAALRMAERGARVRGW